MISRQVRRFRLFPFLAGMFLVGFAGQTASANNDLNMLLDRGTAGKVTVGIHPIGKPGMGVIFLPGVTLTPSTDTPQ